MSTRPVEARGNMLVASDAMSPNPASQGARRRYRASEPAARQRDRRAPRRVGSRIALPRIATTVLLALVALFVMAAPVLATDPFRISGTVTDQANVLSTSEEQQVAAAIDSLEKDTGVLLSVVFVDTTGGTGIDAWTDQMLQLNGFGAKDALLVVAVDDRAYRVHADPLTDAQAQEVATAIRPALSSEDWAGAALGTVDALRAQLTGSGPAPSPAATPASGGAGGGGGNPPPDTGGVPWVPIILIVIGGLIVVLVTVRLALDQRLRARSPEERDIQTGDLARRANVLLVQTDDAVRNAEQEVGFAEAQFGDEAAPYRAAVAAAQGDLKAAFAARQQLDDDIPDDATTRRKLLETIVASCETARKRLSEQAAAFDTMRKLEANAPAILAGLQAEVSALQARLPASRATREALGAYAAADWSSVAGNIPEAEKRIAFASGAVGTDPTRADAGRTARRAQTAVAEAGALLDAIDRLATSLESSRTQAESELTAAEHDLDAADAAARAGSIPPAVAQRIEEARTLVATAKALLGAEKPDVLGALKSAQQANLIGDEVLAGIRGTREQAARDAAALDTAIRTAQIAVTRASDFIATRRQGVLQQARTRLAEAERHLDAAVQQGPSDPRAATAEAVQAQRLADEAYRLAGSDFDMWDSGGFGGPVARGAEGEIIGAVLGGLIGGMLGSGRGGFGGTPWGGSSGPFRGGSGGFGGFGGGGGGRGGGSWGGMLGGGRGGGRF